MSIANIGKTDDQDNSGGVRQVLFALIEEIDVMPEEVDGIIADAITFLSGGFSMLYSTTDKGAFTETENPSPNGSTYLPKITAFVPKDQPEILASVELMAGRRFVVVAEDNNDMMRVAGRPEDGRGMQVKIDRNVVNDWSGTNGTLITFYGEFDFRAPFYQSDITHSYYGCPTLLDLLETASFENIKEGLTFWERYIDFLHSLSESELLNLTTTQQRNVVKNSSSATVVYGWSHMPDADDKMRAYYGIAAPNVVQANYFTNSTSTQSFTFAITGKTRFDWLNPDVSMNYSSLTYTLNGSPVTLPFTADVGDSLVINFGKTIGAAPGVVALFGHYTDPLADLITF